MAKTTVNIVIQDFKRVESAFDSLIRRMEGASRASAAMLTSLSQQMTNQIAQLNSTIQSYNASLNSLHQVQTSSNMRSSQQRAGPWSFERWTVDQARDASILSGRHAIQRMADIYRDMSSAYGGYRSQQGQGYALAGGAISGAVSGASTGMLLGGPVGAGVGAVVGGLGGAVWANYEMSLQKFQDSLQNATGALDGIGKRLGSTTSLDEFVSGTDEALRKTRLLAMSSRTVDPLGNVTISAADTMSGRVAQYRRVGARVGLGLGAVTDLALAAKEIGVSSMDDATLQAIAQVQKSYGPNQALAFVKTMLAVDPQAGETRDRARNAAREALPLARAGFQIADLTPVDETVAAEQLVRTKSLLSGEDPQKLQQLVYGAFATPGMTAGTIKTMFEHLSSRGSQWLADKDATQLFSKYGVDPRGSTVADMMDSFTANLAERYKAAPNEAAREAITGQFYTDYMAAKISRSAPLTRGIVAMAQRRAQGLTALSSVAENASSRVPLLSETAPEFDVGFVPGVQSDVDALLGLAGTAGGIQRTDDVSLATKQTLAEMTAGLEQESKTVVGDKLSAQEDQRLSAERSLQEQLAKSSDVLSEYTAKHDLFRQSMERSMEMLNNAIDVVTRDQLPRITATDVGRSTIK